MPKNLVPHANPEPVDDEGNYCIECGGDGCWECQDPGI